jgi:16S rRNA processing protein RimM
LAFFLAGMQKQDLIKLGECKKPHGIKGELSFFLYNPEESILKKGIQVHLKPLNSSSNLQQEGEIFSIEKINFANKCICRLEGIQDRNQVEAMLPFGIYLERDKFPALAPGEYYLCDLIGLSVQVAGVQVGEIKDFYDNGAQTVISFSFHGEAMELPLIDQFFPAVNIEKGYIELNPPEVIT